MPQIAANGIQLAYEVTGDRGATPVLLIMGLGAQLTRWPEPFYRGLADSGFYVIRFDNRDVGLSTRIERAGSPELGKAVLRAALGLPIRAPYDLSDLAADTVGLIDALDLGRVHVVGVSMGGMIAQMLAAQHGDRVRSLVSIMSTSGDRRLPQADWRLRMALVRRPKLRGERQKAIDWTIALYKRISSPAFPPDETLLREHVASDYDRGYYPVGVRRQMNAILASGSRTSLLRKITAPTLILHGADDPLVPVAAAYDLQRRIAGAQLEVFAGMGHDLPRALIPRFTTHIVDHLRRADAGAQDRRGGGAAVS